MELAILKRNEVLNRLDVVGMAYSGGWANLPDGTAVSPAKAGWKERGYELVEVLPAEAAPPNTYFTGERSVELVNGVARWVEVHAEAVTVSPQLTARQFWLAAHDAGVTKESLISMIRGSYPEAEAGRIVLELEVSTHFSRDYPLMNELYPLMGISEVEFETLWLWASKI